MRVDLPSYWMLIRQTPEELHAKLEGSPEEAARWVEAAAHNGSPSAIVNFGHMLLGGHGVPRDPARALRWFKIAADADDAEGINMVGRCYENGWGVTRDLAEAAVHFERAAAMEHDWARFNLGMVLVAGEGRDLPRALSLFVAAARQGNAKAMNMLGRFREEGWSCRAKAVSARRWYARAASGGCFRGQFHLARFLMSEERAEDAAAWLRRSLAQAPEDFRRDVVAMLSRHPDPAIRGVVNPAEFSD